MLSGGLFGRLEDRVNELVENAIVQLDRSTRFLDDSVIIERVLRDDFKLSLQATKADDLVLAALNAHEISSSDQPQYPIPSATSLRVMVDVRRVHQALVAFLEYSKQYCAEGSAPTIFVERHEQMVRFTITATKVKSALESTVVDRNESPIWLRVRVARLLVELHNGTWGQSSQESHWVAFPRLASGPSSALRALAKEVVQELRAELLDTLPQQAEAIRLGLEPECSLELRRRGLVIAHNLRGTAGSCGLSELGVAAGQVEDCYRLTQSGERPDEKLIVAALDALNQAMKHALG
jgi:HPt (histidine-containing phosphotransfer) domain-containing protein